MTEKSKHFKGEEICSASYKSGDPCKNTASYLYKNRVRCGVHSKMGDRKVLKINPKKKEVDMDLIAQHQELVMEKKRENQEQDLAGDVKVGKLKMMKRPVHLDGYLKVFPNYRHGKRKDGLGLPSLSPMKLGPVIVFKTLLNDDEPETSEAYNIENYWQASKVYPCEVNKKGDPTPDYYSFRETIFSDEEPHRHKFSKGSSPPLYSLIVNKYGKELRLSYLQARYFYCHNYEKLAMQQDEFTLLKKKIRHGYNLLILGYDGRDIPDTTPKGLYKEYKNKELPFGHEIVLFCLLTLKKKLYPWRVYYKKHVDVYE